MNDKKNEDGFEIQDQCPLCSNDRLKPITDAKTEKEKLSYCQWCGWFDAEDKLVEAID